MLLTCQKVFRIVPKCPIQTYRCPKALGFLSNYFSHSNCKKGNCKKGNCKKGNCKKGNCKKGSLSDSWLQVQLEKLVQCIFETPTDWFQ